MLSNERREVGWNNPPYRFDRMAEIQRKGAETRRRNPVSATQNELPQENTKITKIGRREPRNMRNTRKRILGGRSCWLKDHATVAGKEDKNRQGKSKANPRPTKFRWQNRRAEWLAFWFCSFYFAAHTLRLVKIDYLKEGSDDCPLVRIYDFDSEDAKRLRRTFQALADGSIERVRLELVESVDGTQLTFARSAQDGGVTEIGSKNFEVTLSSSSFSSLMTGAMA
jgi:hypothetical protein